MAPSSGAAFYGSCEEFPMMMNNSASLPRSYFLPRRAWADFTFSPRARRNPRVAGLGEWSAEPAPEG